jgi:hypothetical protein
VVVAAAAEHIRCNLPRCSVMQMLGPWQRPKNVHKRSKHEAISKHIRH